MKNRIVDMLQYRGGSKSTLFTGRPQGKEVRKELKLEEEDNLSRKVIFTIPEGTTSFNPSFFLGLLYESIVTLESEGFSRKYEFDLDKVSKDYRSIIKTDLMNGMRHAHNSKSRETGFGEFL